MECNGNWSEFNDLRKPLSSCKFVRVCLVRWPLIQFCTRVTIHLQSEALLLMLIPSSISLVFWISPLLPCPTECIRHNVHEVRRRQNLSSQSEDTGASDVRSEERTGHATSPMGHCGSNLILGYWVGPQWFYFHDTHISTIYLFPLGALKIIYHCSSVSYYVTMCII